jgi:hypothetical protein
MKRLFTFLLLVLPWVANAQMAIIDVTPTTEVFQIKSEASQIQTLAHEIESINNLVSLGKTASNTYKTLTSTYTLYEQTKADLLAVKSIAGLKWSNMGTIIQGINAIATGYQALVPNPNQGTVGQVFTPGAGSGEGAKNIFYAYNGRDQSALTEPTMMTNMQQSVNTKLQLDDAASIRKIQTADFYDKVADDLAAKAVELSAAINTASTFSMTHAERLASLKACADFLLESADLRTKADELREKALTQTPTQQEKTRQQRQDLMFTEYQGFTAQ